MQKVNEGLRHVSASTATLSFIMDDGTSFHLNQGEVALVLAEIAGVAPGLLHAALEHRLVSLVAAEVLAAAPPP